MKKRHLFGLFAMAAFACVSCSQDEVVSQSPDVNKAIEFGTYVGRDASSRATVIDNAALAQQGFGVFAYYTGQNDFVATTSNGNVASPCNFMSNEVVKGTNTGTDAAPNYSWTYSPLKYWPNNSGDKLTFFAYAPYIENTTVNPGLASFEFIVADDVKDQKDLLWAAPHMNVTKATIDGAIDFQFKHALSRIGFDVQTMIDKVNADDAAGSNKKDDETKTTGTVTAPDNGTALNSSTTVVVKKVTLSGKFITSGILAWTEDAESNPVTYTAAITNSTSPESSTTYTLEAVMGTGDNPTLATNFKAENQTHQLGAKTDKLIIHGQSVSAAETQLNADDSYIMIIPKKFEDEDKLKIEVIYDVVTTDDNLTSGYSQVTNTISTEFTDIEFKAGKAYKFSLHLGLTSVKLSATVANWSDTNNPEEDYAVNVPLNTPIPTPTPDPEKGDD